MIHGPYILNLYKPRGLSSQQIVSLCKRKLKSYRKIGHFGTLDPFAQGVLMLGVDGAQRLNEYIHECLPKTYLAKGILGVETDTGDLTVAASQLDQSCYTKSVIANFELDFIQTQLEKSFLGKYMQSPHKYSAAKHEGRALHQWARDGVHIKKEEKERFIYKIEIVKYDFPHLWIRFEVSSGTYIRTLFSHCAQALGTIGVLEDLIREKVGHCTVENSFNLEMCTEENLPVVNMQDVLPFSSLVLKPKEARLYSHGVKLQRDRAYNLRPGQLDCPYYWVEDIDHKLYGVAQISEENEICSRVNFS